MLTQQQPAQGQMSQEQLNQLLKRMLVGEQHVNGLFGETTSPQLRQQTLQQIIDGAVQEAITRAQYMFQGEMGKFRSEYDQSQALLQEMYREHSLGKFFGEYPDLKDYRQFVEDSVAEVSGAGEAPKSIQEFFQKVAQSAEGRVKALKPEFTLTAKQAAQQAAQGQQQSQGQSAQGQTAAGPGTGSPTPPAYTGPSSPTGGPGAGQPGRKNAVSDIWGDD